MITPPRQPGAVIAKAMLAAAVDQAPQQASPEELAALESLLAHAQRDSGQSRVVADFLLAWWNSGSCGAFDLTSLWSLDTAIVADMTVVFGLIDREEPLRLLGRAAEQPLNGTRRPISAGGRAGLSSCTALRWHAR